MRKWKISMVLVGSLLLVAVLATTAAAQQRTQRAAGIQGILQEFGIRQFVAGLQLTQAQREDIKSILQGHKTEIIEARKELLHARLALLQKDLSAPNKFGSAQANIMALGRDILAQIEKVLTPDQLAALEKRQQAQIARIEARLKRLGGN